GGPAVAENVAGELGPVGRGVGSDDEGGGDAEFRVDDRHVAVGARVQLSHPADTDQPDADAVFHSAHVVFSLSGFQGWVVRAAVNASLSAAASMVESEPIAKKRNPRST